MRKRKQETHDLTNKAVKQQKERRKEKERKKK
jgi:hypothetical protein